MFARPPAGEDENWLGFVSLEFLESHQGFFVPDIPPLFVVPKAGQKEDLDDWLENELAGIEASLLTWRQQAARAQDNSRSMMVLLALLESVIVIVAAVALAVLNHIFVSQRRSEFGLLHALGYGRLRLVWRVVGETAFTTGVAWGLSAILFLIGLLGLQLFVFTPLGLNINPFNPVPWLFTLPIPVVVLAVTGGAIARTLSKLDPVSVVERR
jgi:ABC-type antimicrobial peptide transport system permease subunit